MDPLKLVALDKDDLAVISTHLQDAVVNVGDIRWMPDEKRLVLGLNRFDWEAANGDGQLRRRRTALRFDRVNALKCRNVSPDEQALVLNLLAVDFDEHDAPGGFVILTFSGGVALRVDVECLEAELVDLGPAWSARARPAHPEDSPPSRG